MAIPFDPEEFRQFLNIDNWEEVPGGEVRSLPIAGGVLTATRVAGGNVIALSGLPLPDGDGREQRVLIPLDMVDTVYSALRQLRDWHGE